MTGPLSIAEFAPDFPDHELVLYRNTAVPIEGCPRGFECLIAIPKAKLPEAGKNGPRPLWRHGDVISVKPAGG